MTILNLTTKAFLLVGLILVSSTLLANGGQKHPAPPNRPQVSQMVAELSTALSLSAAQISQISDLFESHFGEMDKLMQHSQKADRQKMDGYRKEFEASVKAVLRPEQIVAFDAFQKSHGPQSDQQKPRRK